MKEICWIWLKLFYFIYPLISSSSQVKIAVPPSPDWRELLQAIPDQYLPEPPPYFLLYSDASADPDFSSHKMLLQTALHFSSGHHPGCGIYIRNHADLGMSGISLDSFNISTIQFQLIGNTAVSKTVENNRWEIIVLNQLLQWLPDRAIPQRKTKRTCHDQVIVHVFISKNFLCLILFFFPFDQHLCDRLWKENLSDTAVCLRCFQNTDCFIGLAFFWKYQQHIFCIQLF